MNRSTGAVAGAVGWLALLVVIASPASAHGSVAHGSDGLALPLVLALPVLAGLVGGVVALVARGWPPGGRGWSAGVLARFPGPRGWTSRFQWARGIAVAVGLLLVALGGTFAVAALAGDPRLGAAGLVVGALATRWVGHRGGRVGPGRHRGHHAGLALGGVCAHRVVEGAALGALYAVGAAVGGVGVAVVAGHTALETAAVGALAGPRRLRALGAVGLVQVGYVVGAVGGFVAGGSVPAPVEALALGLVGGVFLLAGVAEARHARSADPGGCISGATPRAAREGQ